MNRKLIISIFLVAMVALAGCAGEQAPAPEPQQSDDEQLAEDTGEDVSNVKTGGSYWYEIKLTEKNQQQLVRAQPPQVMEHSLERQNLINRYEYLNDRTNTHHVYLIDEGQVVAYYVAQGKVSSVNSKLTNDKQIVKIQGADYDDGFESAAGPEGPNWKTVESPQMDGSYGENGDAIFFFTTEGEYVESSLDYVVSEEPRNIQSTVILHDSVDDESDEESDNSGSNNSTES